MSGKDIRTFDDFKRYAQECTDGQLLGLSIECNKAIQSGSLSESHFMYDVYRKIKENRVGINVMLDMIMTVSFELVRRIATCSFSKDEYATHYDMIHIANQEV